MLNVAYADDHILVRKGIASLLNKMSGLNVYIEADNGIDLIEQIERADSIPDVCILDINMPGMNGFETIIQLKRKWPHIGVLVLTVFDNEYYFIRMIRSGANGYLLKSCDPEDIMHALLTIHNKGMYYNEAVARSYFQAMQNKDFKMPDLTATEISTLKYCCSDLSYAEIADKLGVTTRSVEGYRDGLFKKLQVSSRVGLAMFAVQFGIVTIEINTSENNDLVK